MFWVGKSGRRETSEEVAQRSQKVRVCDSLDTDGTGGGGKK